MCPLITILNHPVTFAPPPLPFASRHDVRACVCAPKPLHPGKYGEMQPAHGEGSLASWAAASMALSRASQFARRNGQPGRRFEEQTAAVAGTSRRGMFWASREGHHPQTGRRPTALDPGQRWQEEACGSRLGSSCGILPRQGLVSCFGRRLEDPSPATANATKVKSDQ